MKRAWNQASLCVPLRFSALSAFLSLGLLLSACTIDEKKKEPVYGHSFFDSIPTAERGGKPIGPRADNPSGPLESKPDDQLITTGPRGEKVLLLQSPRHVVVQLRTLLTQPADESLPAASQPDALLYDQLISDATKKRFLKEGKKPNEALDFLKERKEDILALLAAMPMGEMSIDVSFERAEPTDADSGRGKDTYRLRVRRSRARALEFDSLWVVRENGKFKFLWVS